MKTFLEEYGVVVVAAIIITIIVVAATPLGTKIKDGINSAVDKLTAKLGAQELTPAPPELSGP